MRLYLPEPNPPCKPKNCVECDVKIDGDEVDGYWLERENKQDPNIHVLFCLDCCVEKMNSWANYPDVDDAAMAREILYE